MHIVRYAQNTFSLIGASRKRTGLVLPGCFLGLLLLSATLTESIAQEQEKEPDLFYDCRREIAWNVVLPAGQSEIIKTIDLKEMYKEYLDVDLGSYLVEKEPMLTPYIRICVRAEDGTAPLEVLIRLREVWKPDAKLANNELQLPPELRWQMAVNNKSYYSPTGSDALTIEYNDSYTALPLFAGDNEFRDLLFGSKGSIYFLNFRAPAKKEDTIPMLTVALRRPVTCQMTVAYWGDFQGTDYGDLAYYNDFMKEGSPFKGQGGVGDATGSGADPGALRLGGQLMGIATNGNPAAVAPVLSAEEAGAIEGSEFDVFGGSGPDYSPGDEIDDEVQPEPYVEPNNAALPDEFMAFIGGADMDPGEREKFGLSMATRKSVAGKQSDPFTTFVRMSASTTLGAASREDISKFIGTPYQVVTVPLSRVYLLAGAAETGGPSPPRFEWNAGEKGAAALEIHQGLNTPGLAGIIYGHLYSPHHKQADGRYSMINFAAKFIAADGALGCDFGTKK